MPLSTAVRFDPLLTNISIQYQPAAAGYLADSILPPVPVAKEAGSYWVYDKSRFDAPDAKRAPRSEYNRVDWDVSTDTYLTQKYGLEGEIDDEERENAASPLDLDVDTTEIVTDMLLNDREKRVANLVLSTSNITQNTTLTGSDQWNDDSSDPQAAIATGRQTIWAATGQRPNRLAIGYLVFEALKRNPAIKAIIQYTERAIVTTQLLATLFEVDEVLVGSVLRRTSKEGQTDALTDVWGKDALLFYAEKSPSLKRATFGYQLRQHDMKVFRYREDKRDTDVIRVTEKQAEKIVSVQLAYLIKAAVA